MREASFVKRPSNIVMRFFAAVDSLASFSTDSLRGMGTGLGIVGNRRSSGRVTVPTLAQPHRRGIHPHP